MTKNDLKNPTSALGFVVKIKVSKLLSETND